MLEELYLKNFQIHKKRLVKFGRRVTTIIGANTSGKTALVRALAMLAFNDRESEAFVTHGESHAFVRLKVDGRVVSRKKGKSVNLYRLDGKTYRAFGRRAVPEEVAKVLNVSAINVQKQMDAPFWFSDTAGQVSRDLNKIVNLGAIDSSLAYATAELKKARTLLDDAARRKSLADARFTELEYIPTIEAKLSGIYALKARFDATASSFAAIASALERATAVRQELRNAVRAKAGVLAAVELGAEVITLSRDHDDLHQLITGIQANSTLAAAETPTTKKLDKLKTRVEREEFECQALEQVITTLERSKRDAWEARSTAESARKQFEEMNPGGACPMCGTPNPTKS